MKEQEQLVERINFCERTIKAFRAGQLIIDGDASTLVFQVCDSGRIRIYRTLEKLEAFTEKLITHRNQPSDACRAARRIAR